VHAAAKIMELKISILGLLALLTLDSASSRDMPSAKKSAPIIGKLFIDPCSTLISGGKANLRIGALSRQAQAYIGDYQFKVSPYFFKNEKGKLSIEVADDTLDKLANGMAVDFTGQATTSGSGKTRRIDGKATPAGNARGTVKLWFIADNRELVFTTSYHFDEK
jgi:hypothetical protein